MAKQGDRIDRFTLVRQLGAGGMGATWEAVRQSGHDFEQRVAIKLAAPEVLATTDGLDSFRREAALAASLRHPNIAAVLDVDERGGYIVCELVDGADLRAVLRAVPGGRLDPVNTVHVLGQIARGLAHAHRRILRGRSSPVIHRDMSPGNVVIDYDGNVKIVDFGIAKAMINGVDVPESLKGKLSYMAPEQVMGARVDGRVDQYALGVIAYEALSGVRPNDGAHEGETLSCILGGKRMPLGQRVPALAPGLARIVERMLALRPEQRYPSLDGVLDALSAFTPPLTTHRSLIPLVITARQPHTIVNENGRFVSRPIDVEPILLALQPATDARLFGGATPPKLPRRRRDPAAAVGGNAALAAGQQAMLATLGATDPAGPSASELVARGATEGHAPQLGVRRVQQPLTAAGESDAARDAPQFGARRVQQPLTAAGESDAARDAPQFGVRRVQQPLTAAGEPDAARDAPQFGVRRVQQPLTAAGESDAARDVVAEPAVARLIPAQIIGAGQDLARAEPAPPVAREGATALPRARAGAERDGLAPVIVARELGVQGGAARSVLASALDDIAAAREHGSRPASPSAAGGQLVEVGSRHATQLASAPQPYAAAAYPPAQASPPPCVVRDSGVRVGELAAPSGDAHQVAWRSPSDTPACSRWLLRGLTGGGVALLALVAWIELIPDALSSWSPWDSAPALEHGVTVHSVAPGAQLTAPVVAKSSDAPAGRETSLSPLTAAGGSVPAATPSAPEATSPPAASAAPGPSPAPPPMAASRDADPAAAEARARPRIPDGVAHTRVRVLPRGRVWVDDEPQGEAAPLLRLTLAACMHVIAVGRDTPQQSRTIELKSGTSRLVAFDLHADQPGM